MKNYVQSTHIRTVGKCIVYRKMCRDYCIALVETTHTEYNGTGELSVPTFI